mmetsp:Transcript_90004/g.259413  ORF Transcript_90004/g.259413 Transcript_90004/m.259413 type:complete len:83 (+) Transcript_90004:29-277(+)
MGCHSSKAPPTDDNPNMGFEEERVTRWASAGSSTGAGQAEHRQRLQSGASDPAASVTGSRNLDEATRTVMHRTAPPAPECNV